MSRRFPGDRVIIGTLYSTLLEHLFIAVYLSLIDLFLFIKTFYGMSV